MALGIALFNFDLDFNKEWLSKVEKTGMTEWLSC